MLLRSDVVVAIDGRWIWLWVLKWKWVRIKVNVVNVAVIIYGSTVAGMHNQMRGTKKKEQALTDAGLSQGTPSHMNNESTDSAMTALNQDGGVSFQI